MAPREVVEVAMSASARAREHAEVIAFSDATEAAEELGSFQQACEIGASGTFSEALVVRFLARSGRFGKAGVLAACAAEIELVDGTRIRAVRVSEASDLVGTPIAIAYRTQDVAIEWPERQVDAIVLQVPGSKKTFRFRNVFAE